MDITAYQDPQYLKKLAQHELAAVISDFHKRTQKRLRRARLLAGVALSLWAVALLILFVSVAPYLWYQLFPITSEQLAERLGVTVDVDKSAFGAALYEEEKPAEIYIPPLDPSLPKENWLSIPGIGVKTQIREGDDWEKALKEGVWRVPELGTPENRRMPIILAAHRFGYLRWSNQYRRENSFYNLPKVEVGDKIEIIWNQRKYVFEIYEGYTDKKIREYEADLILYTCELLNSDRRIVRYGRLLETSVAQ